MEQEKRELIERMKRLAAAYTPEWKFDEENPDIATALAMLYADMFYGTLRRYHRLPEKNRTAFFNTIGAKLMPSVPAEGYVAFGLSSDEFGGVEVLKGLLVTAESGEEDNGIPFETQNSVYVTPSRLEEIILTDGGEDRIQQLYETGEGWKGTWPFYLFQSEGENLQDHGFCFGQNQVLNLAGPAEIPVEILPCRFSEDSANDLDWLTDEKETVFEYWSQEGFIPFGGRRREQERLVLELKEGQPPLARMERQESEDYAIRCRLLKPYNRPDFSVEGLRLTSRAWELAPDVVQTERGEEGKQDIFPFGERPMPFSEVYIAADQVFSKAGAKVTLRFRMDYEKVPLDSAGETERDWKLVMKREDFVPDPEYDVTIERVIWEYYNGTGWSRLFDGKEYGHIFNGGDGSMGQQFTLTFTCPDDMQPFLYNSVESRYIRIRVLKMNNLFKQKGNYITPVMSDLHFSFAYKGQGKTPDFLDTFNNQKYSHINVREQNYGRVRWTLFQGIGDWRKALYLRFSKPLSHGPLKILFAMEESIQENLPRLEFEYYGTGGFGPLSVMDETENMRKSGALTFMGKMDMESVDLWGRKGYWLRITDADGGYGMRTSKARMPMTAGIFLNVARVTAVRTMPEEYFKIEPKEKNKVCVLLNQEIQNLEVWVDESRSLTEGQRERLRKECSVREEMDAQGQLLKFWVKWEETEDFCLSGPEDRHYTADRNEGVVAFSDGLAGAIPPSGDGETIRICYSCGGGEKGNQPKGHVNQMTRALGYINQVTNPQITNGGCDQETIQEAVTRSARRLRHGERAVTARDYEDLAMEASRAVLKVKCFPNCGISGAREMGSVTLVVLQRNFKDGRLYFDRVKQEILNSVRPKLPGNQNSLGRFYVVEPKYLELRCRMEITVRDFNDVFDVKARVLRRLEEFLNPISGNFDRKGWEIGRIPDEIQITNAIKGIPGIRYIREVRLAAFMQSRQGWVEVDRESEDERRFAVALNGEHQIAITVEEAEYVTSHYPG